MEALALGVDAQPVGQRPAIRGGGAEGQHVAWIAVDEQVLRQLVIEGFARARHGLGDRARQFRCAVAQVERGQPPVLATDRDATATRNAAISK